MNAPGILLPLLALIGWTLLVLLLIPFHRVRAGMAGRIQVNDFLYGESTRVPPDVAIPNRAYMNLLEAPVLFYAVGLMLFVTQTADSTATTLAWAYVGLRIVHSLIHLTYNHVLHRLAAFALSNAVLLLLWLKLALSLLG
ncbi:hypothetical protein DFR24_1431 [Panacagrimonas perspica]|uniref:MAPEG family protein n=1 Tax=Panacagrimonas perspica TaxID=381431 RepID=A0A4R7PD39_9GAMM|nr:MAPEG family protein [Panacagrimonas perspica]TDU32043.1 hypothetical protein DFR24_1431 [Panacagrimonas perspica]THD04427.1 hypothetical protein B1810_05320 [Panacagrimonas perspica]